MSAFMSFSSSGGATLKGAGAQVPLTGAGTLKKKTGPAINAYDTNFLFIIGVYHENLSL